MLVDLNIFQKKILIIGGGRETTRKVQGLTGQGAQLIFIASAFHPKLEEHLENENYQLITETLSDASRIEAFFPCYMVLATTDDKALNRSIINAAKATDAYVYSVDDPEYSDFSHPAVINFKNSVRLALSTNGKSPLMARKLRESLESALPDLISELDLLQIRLQSEIREEAKTVLSSAEQRKSFLQLLQENPAIQKQLSQNQFNTARDLALALLREYSLPERVVNSGKIEE
ncbi:MAG: bifunctional precorrin-2 dehydrogenase/sirohydrochlorin ferrochelatase [Candidatus Nitrohelix vancouverensis]|uniref:precorrin-2 dehydrogenase n=1 Tax=Candidatus Nitrohelix vancouverensis TaxID=2705534 RepID=A0A7T0C3P2_9BACT|nr:MAG: bifunctional precorrin-2 dehydrogenase/sirohydrochlorin ferrochelatase [Candidatus Nitrohelix vancouverensis]